MVKKITAVLFVEQVAPCARFWAEPMGFQIIAEVPSEDGLAFSLLQRDGVELMYQSYASADQEAEAIRGRIRRGPTFLYIEVADLDAALTAMRGVDLLKEVNTTFYGAKEFSVLDPGGHVVTFAQQGAA